MNINWKTVGTITTIAGAILSVIGSIAGEKNTEATITEKVNEAVKNLTVENNQ